MSAAQRVLTLAAVVAAVAPLAAAGLTSGSADQGITMWSTNRDEVVGSACGYASSEYGGIGSLAAQASPYVNGVTKFYAAVDNELWSGGQGCGKCYRVSYGGVGGTDPGRAGEAVVQVVDTGSAKPFDLIYDAFSQVTGASTGVFPASWEQVACQTSAGGPKGAVLAASVDSNAGNLWWIRAILYNLERGVSSAQLTVGGGASYSMTRSGAFWDMGGLGGALKPIVIIAKLDDGSTLEVDLSDASQLAAVRWAEPSQEPAQQPTVAPAVRPTAAPTPAPTAAPTLAPPPTPAPLPAPSPPPTPSPPPLPLQQKGEHADSSAAATRRGWAAIGAARALAACLAVALAEQ